MDWSIFVRNLFGLFVLVSGVVHAAPIFLARVGLGASEGLTAVAPLAAVVADLGDFCLVRASDAELSSLAAQGFDVAVLDRVGDEDYYFVQAAADFDQDLLAGCCRVLDRYARGFIVAATEEGVRELNRMPVELARVAREPVLLSGRSARLPALPAVDDSLVWRLVNSVDADTVLGNIRRLQNFLTRYSTTESLRQACSWMRAKLTTFGCDSAWLDTWSSQYAPNVVGVKTGKTTPGLIYIIDGHIDNTSDRQPDSCPGADDNASGTAAVIEAARVFADVDFACTVWFIGFSGEEQGLLGSGDFAQRCRARGDSVCGVFNFDMISYGRQDLDSFRVIGTPSNPDCSWLIDFYIAQADTFSALKPIRIMDAGARYSDHSSFWDQGYVAFCGIEDDFTPEYHTLGDTIGPLYYVNCGTNNWLMATEAIRAAVASIAKLAGASPRTGVEEETPSRPVRIARVIPTVGRAPVALRFTQKPPRGTSVEIYNGDGRLVDALPVSNSAAEWQGSAAGVYFLRLTDGGVSSAAKVVLTD
ncbi:M28 family peptidase [candidate division WOR-3 bacterium]|uniref:M28 family peptidase n=1 Tax=candidate division WOR-3 bacterium TaxID=2052148 RepID=A0A938BQJ3_UNCW3|nr:M28 family peptidase [candidate division WOR-3 bacterium]